MRFMMQRSQVAWRSIVLPQAAFKSGHLPAIKELEAEFKKGKKKL
jgi:hypothetical protein